MKTKSKSYKRKITLAFKNKEEKTGKYIDMELKKIRNIFTPYTEAYHHESISRGAEDNPEKIVRFNKEVDYMKKRHADILKNGDPYYNPNLTLLREDFSLR